MDTHAIVNLGAIRRNARRLSEFADKPVLAPIKANAYGHGAPRVALALEQDDFIVGFAVATASEVLELRAAGVSREILLLTPPSDGDLGRLVAVGASFVVSSSQEIAGLQREASAQDIRVRVHLKVNTGLNRLGARPEDAVRMMLEIARTSSLEFYGLMTHLVDSEDADPAHAMHQIEAFRNFCDAHQPDVKYRHAANTGGVLNRALGAEFDLVRPGIGLYGYAPGPEMEGIVALEPAMTLVSRVIFLKFVQSREIVGYNASWTAARESRLATVRIGYADGYHRSLSNRASMIVGGGIVPVAGRVSMDQTVLDVTDLDSELRIGDAVTVLGSTGITAQTVADWAGTNAYEVLTSIAPRVERVYRGS